MGNLLTGYHGAFSAARSTDKSNELPPLDLDINSSQDLVSWPERVGEFDFIKLNFFNVASRSVLDVFRCFDDAWLETSKPEIVVGSARSLSNACD